MRLLTIRQTAATGILPENRLRTMQREGKLPGFIAGNRFLVDVEQLEKLLREASTLQTGKEGGRLCEAEE